MSTRFDRAELQEVLQKPTADKVEYFRNKRIGHPMLLNVRDLLCSTIKLRAGVDLAIVTGPTGAGKSHVAILEESEGVPASGDARVFDA